MPRGDLGMHSTAGPGLSTVYGVRWLSHIFILTTNVHFSQICEDIDQHCG